MGTKFIFQIVWRSKSITFSLPSNNSIKLMISIGLLAFPHPIYHLQLQNHFSLTSFTLTAGAGRNTFGMSIRHTTPLWENSIEGSNSIITQIQYTMKINQLKSNPIKLFPNPNACIQFAMIQSTKTVPKLQSISNLSLGEPANPLKQHKKLKRNFHACLRWAPQK